MVTSGLLVVAFLDHPYADWEGSLQPDEMRVTLFLIDDGHVVPCTARRRSDVVRCVQWPESWATRTFRASADNTRTSPYRRV
ncbi:hypothetical protein EAH80_18785 [Mycobacterium hodleri]|uniref:Uncharacterized protein n=1 Tax=Mycolicibacterium hodleri TaxID=49897 RepID=A0A502E5A5_9MYCO|nr:hypothetical protein EAH80_18785 [Mycolicibacterium hodleri]